MAELAGSEKVTECKVGGQEWGNKKVTFSEFDSYSLKDLPSGPKYRKSIHS